MTLVKQILLVDDDAALRQSLVEQLRLSQEFAIAEAGSAAEALERVRDVRFDAILLDGSLPDMDSPALCRQLRGDGMREPILMLVGSDADVLPAREAGASESLTKPFRLGGLLARLRAQLHQFEQSERASFAIGPYSFHPGAKQLLDPGANRIIRLTEKEVAILRFLYRAGEKVVGREVLLGEVWGYNAAVTTHTLETHIYRLRQKIESDPSNARILITEPGGYRLAP